MKYSDLKRGDRITTFTSKGNKLCDVLRVSKDGDRVILTLTPSTRHTNNGDPFKREFRADAEVMEIPEFRPKMESKIHNTKQLPGPTNKQITDAIGKMLGRGEIISFTGLAKAMRMGTDRLARNPDARKMVDKYAQKFKVAEVVSGKHTKALTNGMNRIVNLELATWTKKQGDEFRERERLRSRGVQSDEFDRRPAV